SRIWQAACSGAVVAWAACVSRSGIGASRSALTASRPPPMERALSNDAPAPQGQPAAGPDLERRFRAGSRRGLGRGLPALRDGPEARGAPGELVPATGLCRGP